MARRSNVSARIASLLATLSPSQASATADFLEAIAVGNANEDIGEIEVVSARAARRKARAAAKAEAEKPARRTRASAKEEPAKPARRARKAAEVEEAPARRTRKPKVEAFEGEVTVDDLFAVLENFEGEPVEGGIRELKPLLEAYGFDAEAIATLYAEAEDESGEKLTTAEKATELGVMLASIKELEAKIVATIKEDEEALDDVIEELDLELSETARAGTIAKAIIEAMLVEMAAGEDEEEDEEDDAEDDEEEEVAPRRKRAAAKVAEKPARGSKRKAKDADDLNDLDDLD